VFGGDAGRALSSIIRFKPPPSSSNSSATQNWEILADMKTPRWSHAVVTIGKKMYVIGEYDGNNTLDPVDIFDPFTKKLYWLINLSSRGECRGEDN